MKLLIVDDEDLTRVGVISSIDWKELGITEVFQADDGINGLEAARLHRPDIVLCDVRMPRMDGISMLEKLEDFLPDVVPIFMSGYSDKEYLKAAIKLKAVNYIEKPLDPLELGEAIQEACEQCRQRQRTRRGETLHSMETASRLALLLTAPHTPDQETARQLIGELSLDITNSTCFTAVVIKLDMAMDFSAPSPDEIFASIREYLRRFHLDCIYVEKRVQYVVYFVFGASLPSNAAREEIRQFFLGQYMCYKKFCIAAGKPVTGISKAYQSYTSAVILLQSSFFFPADTFLYADAPEDTDAATRPSLPENPEADFSRLLSDRNQEGCRKFLDTLYRYYDKNRGVLPNQAKDLYYKLFRCVEEAARQLKLTVSSDRENVIDAMENIFSFRELHEKLLKKMEQFFTDARNTVQENSTIYLIKDYISQNYMNETLSVKDISAHVFLSASYVCTFFKNETGKTLNQYLTEYRMEKAKQLLGDPRYKITDISSRVGYNDGNYFGKSFKKYTGLSPSEYREMLS